VTYVSHSASAGVFNSGTGVWSVGNLAVNGSASLTLVVTVNPGTLGTIVNNVVVGAAEPDPNTGNNTANEPTTVTTLADLAIAKSDAPDPVVAGTTLTYTIVVTNYGPSTATSVAATDTIPAGVAYVTSVASQGGYAPGANVWTIGTLVPGASASLTLVVSVYPTTTGSLVNTVRVAGTQLDPDPSNNSTSATTGVISRADLQVSKSDAVDPVVAGTALTYTIVVTNAGPSAATSVLVTDTLPAGVTYVSSAASQGSYNSATSVWNVGNVAAGGSASLTLVVVVNPQTTGILSNTVVVGGRSLIRTLGTTQILS